MLNQTGNRFGYRLGCRFGCGFRRLGFSFFAFLHRFHLQFLATTIRSIYGAVRCSGAVACLKSLPGMAHTFLERQETLTTSLIFFNCIKKVKISIIIMFKIFQTLWNMFIAQHSSTREAPREPLLFRPRPQQNLLESHWPSWTPSDVCRKIYVLSAPH